MDLTNAYIICFVMLDCNFAYGLMFNPSGLFVWLTHASWWVLMLFSFLVDSYCALIVGGSFWNIVQFVKDLMEENK